MSQIAPNAVELICQLHKLDKAVPIGRLLKPWHRKIDERWQIWVNGQMKPQKGGPGGDIDIHPGDCYVEYNGWPAGSFSMIHGEGLLAAGSEANYQTFCDALQSAINPIEQPTLFADPGPEKYGTD